MKRLVAIIIILTLAFCGCSGVKSGVIDENVSYTNTAASSKSSFSGWIMDINETSVLLCGSDSESGLFRVSADDIPIIDSHGDSIDFSELSVSDTVDVTYDGGIMESYPAMFSGISGITVTGHKSSLVPLYRDIFGVLYNTSVGLNKKTEILAFDLSEATNLSEAEKEAFVYLCGSEYRKESFMSTYDELKDYGYLVGDGMFFQNGLLITFAVSETSMDDGFEFSVSKWRGGDGAVGYAECVAKKRNEEWSFETGGAWIS